LLVRHRGAGYQCGNHQEEYGLRFPVIPPELKFIQVPMQVLYRDLVEAAYDAALQQTPIPVNRSGVNLAAHPFLCGMVHGFVLLHVLRHRVVELAIVGANQGSLYGDVAFDLVHHR